MTWQLTKLRDFFLHFDPENPNHLKAADMLQAEVPALMSDDAEWVRTYRGEGKDSKFLEIAANIIKEFEGFRASPYKCAAGVWTIGFGTTYYPDGELVQPTDKAISKERATDYLEYHINHAIVPILGKSIPTWSLMNDNQKAAIISFAYNLGSHFYGNGGFDTITKALSEREQWPMVPYALSLYMNPGSTFERGLRRRRKAEGDLWNKPI